MLGHGPTPGADRPALGCSADAGRSPPSSDPRAPGAYSDAFFDSDRRSRGSPAPDRPYRTRLELAHPLDPGRPPLRRSRALPRPRRLRAAVGPIDADEGRIVQVITPLVNAQRHEKGGHRGPRVRRETSSPAVRDDGSGRPRADASSVRPVLAGARGADRRGGGSDRPRGGEGLVELHGAPRGGSEGAGRSSSRSASRLLLRPSRTWRRTTASLPRRSSGAAVPRCVDNRTPRRTSRSAALEVRRSRSPSTVARARSRATTVLRGDPGHRLRDETLRLARRLPASPDVVAVTLRSAPDRARATRRASRITSLSRCGGCSLDALAEPRCEPRGDRGARAGTRYLYLGQELTLTPADGGSARWGVCEPRGARSSEYLPLRVEADTSFQYWEALGEGGAAGSETTARAASDLARC